jgi:DNA repair protein RecN (Recombination protein N)
MLRHLSIRNVVLIDSIDISFSPGLGVLTGETGAGKSILLDSLSLALGARGDSKLLRPGNEKASISAVFETKNDHPITELLEEHGLDTGESDLVLRRTIGGDGRGRAYINDQPVSVNLLRRIGVELVEIQGQHELHGLLDPGTHSRLLDAFGNLSKATAKTRDSFLAWRTALDALAKSEGDLEAARKDEAYLTDAVQKLAELAPQVGEVTQLEEMRKRALHTEKISDALDSATTELGGDNGAEAGLQRALRTLERIGDVGGQRLAAIIETLERTAAETGEVVRDLAALASETDIDPQEAAAGEDRLFALRAAARRHNVDVDALADELETLKEKLDAINQSDEITIRLAKEVEVRRTAYLATAEALSKERQKAASDLDKKIGSELAPLKLENAIFRTEVARREEQDWSQSGLDDIRFEIRTNPGAAFGPIDKIASGGELARFMLAIKVVLAGSSPDRILVFDEVDSGIGGATAAAVGQRLSRLAGDRQVLVVTHSPQVAAVGNSHLHVSKSTEGELVKTRVLEIVDEARREEIARMISGAAITDEARAAATELIRGAAAA